MIKAVTGRAVHRWHRWRQQHGWQHHMTDRAWLHRLITKWAKNFTFCTFCVIHAKDTNFTFDTPETYRCLYTDTHTHTCRDTSTHRHMHTDTHKCTCRHTHVSSYFITWILLLSKISKNHYLKQEIIGTYYFNSILSLNWPKLLL